MAWNTDIVQTVRYLINDVDGATYSDARLGQTILVAGQLLQSTMDFDNVYSIDVMSSSIMPDPTMGTKDSFFSNVLAMKAAIIVFNSEAKTAASQSWRVKDATSSIDTTASYQAMHQYAKDLADRLDKYIMDYRCGNGMVGGAVTTPVTVEFLSNEGQPIRNFY